MKKIIITLAALAAISTAAWANDAGNDNATFGDGVINGAPDTTDATLLAKKMKYHKLYSQFSNGVYQGYANYLNPSDQRSEEESSRGAQ